MHTDLRIAAAAALLGLALSSPLVAQQTEPGPEDLRALRFYLTQEDDAAVRAELRRLRQLFPGWTPPADPEALDRPDLGPAIDEMYRRIARDEFDTARDLIARTEAEHPEWRPPEEMMQLLRVSEAQQAFDRAVEAGAATTAIGIGRSVPELIACERINNAWNLAEMYVLNDEPESARNVYAATLRTCADTDQLVASLQKADPVTTLDQLTRLADTARATLPEAGARLNEVEDQLRVGRGALPRWSSPEPDTLVPDPPEGAGTVALSGAQSLPPARSMRPSLRPADLSPVRVAAPAPAPAPRPAPGATRAPAATTAPTPAAPSGRLAEVQAAAGAGRWQRCLELSSGSSDARILLQRGWCAYNADRRMEAVSSFRTARTALPTADERRDAGYGLMLSLLSLDMTDEAASHAASLPLTREQRVEVEGQILDQRGVRAYEAGQFTRALAFFDEHKRVTGVVRRDLELLRGYALLNSGDKAQARVVFKDLHEQLATPQTRAALNAAR